MSCLRHLPLLLVLCLSMATGCDSRGDAVTKVFDSAGQAWMQDDPASAMILLVTAIEAGEAKHEHAGALAAKGDYLLRHSDPQGAEAAYAEAASLDPQHPALLAGRGDAALVAGDRSQALESYEAALQQNEFFAPALAGLGLLALQANDLEGAQQWMQDAIAPTATDYEPGIIEAYGLLIAQAPALAAPFETWMTAYLEEHPTDLRSHVLAGRYYERRDMHTHALEMLGWAHRHRPDYPGLTKELALLHFSAGHLAEAVKLFEELHEREPSQESLHLLAIGYANIPEYDNAIALFEKGMREYPDDYRFTLGKGQVLYSMGQHDAAYDILRPLATGGVSYFEVYRELGLIEIARQHWTEAATWLDEALMQGAFDPWTNFERAYLFARTGDRRGFERHMQRVFERGYVTLDSLSSFDNFQQMLDIEWAGAWIEEKRIVTSHEN